MKSKLNLYYDEEGDYLELNVGKYRKGYFREVADGIHERIDEKTGKVTGIGILGLKKRFSKKKRVAIPIDVPLFKS